jgi:hypothetical protein
MPSGAPDSEECAEARETMVPRTLRGGFWVNTLGSTFLASHTELFGLRQVGLYIRGQPMPSSR